MTCVDIGSGLEDGVMEYLSVIGCLRASGSLLCEYSGSGWKISCLAILMARFLLEGIVPPERRCFGIEGFE